MVLDGSKQPILFRYGIIQMWTVERSHRFGRRVKKLEKRHRREVAATLDNLDTYLQSLDQGIKPMQLVKHSFVHNEQMGIHAVDQSPLHKGSKPLRLYVYPDEATETVHVITFGGKDTQSADVNESCEYVRQLQKEQAREEQDDDKDKS